MAVHTITRKSLFYMVYVGILLVRSYQSTASSAQPSLDIKEGLIEICETITRKCASMGLSTYAPTSTIPTSPCKSVPPRDRGNPHITMSLNEMLFDGVKKMDNQKASLDPGGILSNGRAVFVLGNTGSGKTTATQIMAGDLNRLHASFTEMGRKLVIIDDDNRIGVPTTKSRTLIPEYVIHPEHDVAFWDCPGFNDNRGLEVDVAAMYFVKHALDSTGSAKFMLTVTHSSVQPGNDRLNFDLLATHVTILISNVTKLQPAIGLVVTKVGSYSSASGKYLSDGDIILQIREFLEKYLQTKRNDMENSDDKVVMVELASKIKLVEGILGMDTGKNKLYFVRSPEDCGVLGEMNSVRDTRTNLAEMIERLEYVDVTPEDFRFTVKAETRLQLETKWIPENEEEISKSISSSGLKIWTEFERTFYNKLGENVEESTDLLHHTTETIGSLLEKFDETRNEFTTMYSKPESLSDEVYHLYLNLTFEVSCTDLSTLRQLEKQRNFFQLIINENEEIIPNWTQPFSILHNELVDLLNFYQICQKTATNLASYSSQLLLVGLLEKMSIPQFESEEADVLKFLLKHNVATVSLEIFSLWEKMDWIDRNYFTKIVTDAFPNISYKCSKSMNRKNKMRLTIAGNYVKFSDVIKTNKWPLYCNYENVAEISVVALEIIYLDIDLNGQGKELYVSIISPIWQVVLGENDTERNITLDGVHASDPNPVKATDGVNYGDKGKNGAAGLPGGNAGSFFGVYSLIQGGDSLFIDANGGNGGKGQDGGNGHDGKAGKNASYNDFPSAYNTAQKHENLLAGYFEDGKLIHKPPDKRPLIHLEKWYAIMGRNGSVGGDGGNGGNGGTPGNSGKIQLISIGGKRIAIQSKSMIGLLGVPGSGGTGGKGGKDGGHYSCKWNSALVGAWWDRDGCYESSVSTYAISGNDGKLGEYLNPSTYVAVNTEHWRAVLEYKTSFYERPSKLKFSKLIDYNEEVQKILKTVYFAKEVEFLENEFYQKWNMPKHQEIFLSYYQSLLDRLDSYSQSLDHSQLADEDKYGISLLHAIIIGKIIGMRRSETRLNVLDTEGYFSTLVEQLVLLKKEEQEKIISEENSRFKAILEEKIQEAEMLIEHTVQPAIAEAQNELDRLNDDLLQEVNQFINAAEFEVGNRTEAKKKFESLMWIRPLVGVMRTAGTLCSFLGPKGAIAGAVINVGASALGEFAPPVNPSQIRGRNIIPDAANQLHSISGTNRVYYGNKINNIQAQVDVVVKEAQNVQDSTMATEMNSAAQNAILSLSGFKLALTSPDGTVNEVSLTKYEVEVDKSAQKMADVTTKVADAQDEMREAGNDMTRNEQNLRNVAIGLQAAQNVQGIFTSIIDNESELKQLGQLVKEAEQNLQNLRKLKDKFYDELFPEIDHLGKAIQHATEGLPGESRAALSVKNWKVRKVLKMVRGYLQQFTNGFKTQEKFQLSFDALEEALALLIDMYDHIERYEEKKQLADYIANVNSLSSNKINIQDEELKQTLERLEFNVEANLFYQEYQRAMHAFKQWVFPFASNYLGKDSPLGNGELPKNLTELIQVFSKEVQNLGIELKRYKTTTVKGDDILMLTTFTGGLDASKPFYVWSNAVWKDSIKKLLNGEVVHLKADVDMTRQDVYMQHFFVGKSAIKFKTISINVTAHNESRQVELNKNLNKFQLRMTHSGISTYKVKGRKYVMFDKEQSLEYSFQETAKGYITKSMPRHKTESQNADYLMSPYTWWTLKMVPANSMYSFKVLAAFHEIVDLELVGEGVYLNEKVASNETLEKLDLTSYYEELYEGDEFVPKLDGNSCASMV